VRFCVNVSILFTEFPLLERFGRARDAGFDTVELWWPRGEDLAAVRDAISDAGVGVALLNFDAGDMPAGDRGLLSDPALQEDFRANVPVALELAAAVGCKKLNALAGTSCPTDRVRRSSTWRARTCASQPTLPPCRARRS
jgi:hydroxypyruvate isomerase